MGKKKKGTRVEGLLWSTYISLPGPLVEQSPELRNDKQPYIYIYLLDPRLRCLNTSLKVWRWTRIMRLPSAPIPHLCAPPQITIYSRTGDGFMDGSRYDLLSANPPELPAGGDDFQGLMILVDY